MELFRDSCGDALLTLRSDDLHPLRPEVAQRLDMLSHKPSMIGIVTPLPTDQTVKDYFETSTVDDHGILLAYASNGFGYIGADNQLHLAAWLEGFDEPADYIPAEGVDVLIGYIPSSSMFNFRNALEYHRRKQSKL